MTINFIMNAEEFISSMHEMAKTAVRVFKSVARSWRKIVISTYRGDPRVKHLALHARKARTRKKNYHRILKENRRNR